LVTHNKKHDIDSTVDHGGVSGATENNLLSFNASGVPKDSGMPTLKSNLNASTDPTATDDSGEGYVVGSQWINTTTDTSFKCVDATVDTAVWQQESNMIGCKHSIDYAWDGLRNLTGASYAEVATLRFHGTSFFALTLAKIYLVALQTSTTSYCRLYDITNSQEICEVSFVNTTSEIIYMGTISNLTSDAAVWELQYKEDGTAKVDIFSLHLVYE